MAISLNTPLRNYILDQMNAAFDGGKLRIYSGSKPATSNLAPTGTLLAEMTAADFFAAAASGSIALNAALTDASADGTGTAGWFRLSESGDTDALDGDFHRLDGTVTATGGGGDMTLDNASITTGQNIQITGLTVTMPAA